MRTYIVPERSRNDYLDKCFNNDEVNGKGGTGHESVGRHRPARRGTTGGINAEINAEMETGP